MSTVDTEEWCGCKIGRNAGKYDLLTLDDELEHERRENNASLRDLAAYVNTRLLDAILDEVDADIVGDATSIYDALTSDEIPTERRVTISDQLVGLGIDVDEVTDDFVSYQSVRHHLRDCLEIDTGRRGINTIQEGREVIEWSRQRDESVIGRTLGRLRRVDAITTGELAVSVTATITCEACDNVYRIDELLDRRHCNCVDGM